MSTQHEFTEAMELSGHIIDSLIFPKVLDEIVAMGGKFEIDDVQIGYQRTDPSHAQFSSDC